MSKLNRKALRKMLLKEFKMIGMANPDVGMIGHSPFPDMHSGHEHDSMSPVSHGSDMHHKAGVTKEDCCKAVLCLIECCDCPETQQLIRECCEDILSRC